uniref:DUF1760-domain-containing protein n=1 Tax=Bionectria ochroleuca TaxID=29856 RepID=A0A8H7K871_BIOOC
MAPTEEVVQRLKESRPPATDAFTYLTIIEKSLSPDILPTLEEILDDSELTNDIGWDLVDMLISVPGSAGCLERVARLGNPREVILKVLEVMDKTAAAAIKENEQEEEGKEVQPHSGVNGADKFIALVGMLKILHGRLQVRSPSRFLHTTLDTVLRAYDPTSPESTVAVIDFVRSLSTSKRPPLPTRQSSTMLETPFQSTDPSQTAPDPEADDSDKMNPSEPKLINRLLQSFITCIIDTYVNSNSLEWASRLLEYTYPEKVVLSRRSMTKSFNEVAELKAMDALVGQLASVADDLGLSKLPVEEVHQIFASEPSREPLSVDDTDADHPENVQLSTAGLVCLAAYWMVTTDVFDAQHENVKMNIFPHHQELLQNFTGDDAQVEIQGNAGTFEALTVIAVWLDAHQGIFPTDGEKDTANINVMKYHHLVTLISVFHPNIRVRNTATTLAGSVLHSDPDENSRLTILEDLMENCIFSALQACAVTWLREEIIAARKPQAPKSIFGSSECFEKLQYTVFPDLTSLNSLDSSELWSFWAQNSAFHFQVANFALFLFSGKDFHDVAPAGMAAAVEHRYVTPLIQATEALSSALDKKEIEDTEVSGLGAKMQLEILTDTLKRIPLQ